METLNNDQNGVDKFSLVSTAKEFNQYFEGSVLVQLEENVVPTL